MKIPLEVTEQEAKDFDVLTHRRYEIIEAIQEDIPKLYAEIRRLDEKVSNRYELSKMCKVILFESKLSIGGVVSLLLLFKLINLYVF